MPYISPYISPTYPHITLLNPICPHWELSFVCDLLASEVAMGLTQYGGDLDFRFVS